MHIFNKYSIQLSNYASALWYMKGKGDKYEYHEPAAFWVISNKVLCHYPRSFVSPAIICETVVANFLACW